ncbi:pseudoazurin [Rubellimicrobium aerolatum]|uniref:Pseudoazurin n=1 Tax=Rubellimicrobium aerolatum TaxID=490979 RepID=A0ABW0SGI8_9RHOB|nr:pseudoazurin [Rubellimicrobium aerolatum]MBP1807408.1 pseudoazurin [Rubellimicrobium aerolatum]
MTAKILIAAAVAALVGGAAGAETIQVQMLNKGTQGAMVFEPSFVTAQVGDVIEFVATDKGHNVESIEGMLPEGAEAFESKMGEGYSLTVTAEGLYGVACKPHMMMGMVGLVLVGEPTNLDAVTAVAAEELRGKAKSRFEEDLAQVATVN